MYIDETQLKNFIADSGLVSEADLNEAFKEAQSKKSSLGKVLIAKGKISEDDLRRMQAYLLGIPYIDLKGQKIPPEVLSLIPEPIARSHNIIAFKQTPDALEVAMLDADDLQSIDFIRKKVKLKILPRLTSNDSIKSALLQYQKSLKAEFGDIIDSESQAIKTISENLSKEDATGDDLKKLASELPVVRILDALIKHAIIQNASDIHIEVLEKEVLVRYRIDGILHDAMTLPRDVSSSIIARIKVLANLKLDEKRLPQDGRFKVEMTNEKISFRVSIMPTYFGEKAVMRLLKENAAGFSLEGIGFHGEALERIHASMKKTTGMILTTGPTGSGKTTTLYTLLDLLNKPGVNIATIEDPVEYQMARVNQTQVKPDIGFTFANGLRALVRQDPDIIMVGEIRDNETAGLAINASLTGHIVLSTLHTNSAAGAVPRLLDMEVEPFLLVSTINVVIGQRLVRRLTEDKERYFMTKAELEQLGKKVDLPKIMNALVEEKIVQQGAAWEKVAFFKPRASKGSESGYSGRILIHEILHVTPTIKELIMQNKTADEIEVQAKKEGMMTILEDGIFKAAQGITSIEEVFRVSSEE